MPKWDDVAVIVRDLMERRAGDLRRVLTSINRAIEREVGALASAQSLVTLLIDAASYDPKNPESVAKMRELLKGGASVDVSGHRIAWQDGDMAGVARCGTELFREFPVITTDEWRPCPRCRQRLRLIRFIEVEAAPSESNDA